MYIYMLSPPHTTHIFRDPTPPKTCLLNRLFCISVACGVFYKKRSTPTNSSPRQPNDKLEPNASRSQF